jgi:hypothetical protein
MFSTLFFSPRETFGFKTFNLQLNKKRTHFSDDKGIVAAPVLN